MAANSFVIGFETDDLVTDMKISQGKYNMLKYSILGKDPELYEGTKKSSQ